MNDVILDCSKDGSYSVNLSLNKIAHILSGVTPYILLNKYTKNLDTIQNLTIYHKSRPGDSFHQLPKIEAQVLAVHQIHTFHTFLAILTLGIETPPSDFMEYVIKRAAYLARSSDPVLRSSKRYLSKDTSFPN